MKKINKIFLLILFMVFFVLSTKASAAQLNVALTGDATVEENQTKTVTLSVHSSEQEVLSVSGVLQVENIKADSLKVEAKTGWQITYNAVEGNFIVYNAYGAKDADIATITYTAGADDTKKINVGVSNVNITTIDYAETAGDNTSKVITLEKKQQQQAPESSDPGNTNPGNTNPGNTNPGTTNPGTTDPGTQKPTENQPTDEPKNNQQSQQGTTKKETSGTKKDSTQAAGKMPQTGENDKALLGIAGVFVAGTISFTVLRKMRDI